MEEWTLYFICLKQTYNWSKISQSLLLCSQQSLTIALSQLNSVNTLCTIYVIFILILTPPTTHVSKLVCFLQIFWIIFLNFSFFTVIHEVFFLYTPVCCLMTMFCYLFIIRFYVKTSWICFQLQILILILTVVLPCILISIKIYCQQMHYLIKT
jgi:hypothetical protein